MVSKRSSGSRSGSQRPSQVPKSWSEAVPATMKSLARSMQPMLSKLCCYVSLSRGRFITFYNLDLHANERLSSGAVDSRYDRAHKPRSKSPLVKTAADQVGEGLRADVALLP